VTEEGGREMVTPNSRHGTAPQSLSNAAIRRPVCGRHDGCRDETRPRS
jgi:hypothetical protein